MTRSNKSLMQWCNVYLPVLPTLAAMAECSPLTQGKDYAVVRATDSPLDSPRSLDLESQGLSTVRSHKQFWVAVAVAVGITLSIVLAAVLSGPAKSDASGSLLVSIAVLRARV